MTVIADDNKCVPLPSAQPGDHFDLQLIGANKIVLTRLKSNPEPPTSVRIEKRGPFSVGVLNRPIEKPALADALSDFP